LHTDRSLAASFHGLCDGQAIAIKHAEAACRPTLTQVNISVSAAIGLSGYGGRGTLGPPGGQSKRSFMYGGRVAVSHVQCHSHVGQSIQPFARGRHQDQNCGFWVPLDSPRANRGISMA
jgi:hypothetical protein